MVQNVSAGQPQQKPRKGGTFLNALGQTALTAGVGAAGGAGVSALASVVIPAKPERILAQYQDAFLEAAQEQSPSALKDLVSKASPDTFQYAKDITPKLIAGNGAAIIYSMSDEAFKNLKPEQLTEIGLKEGVAYTRQAAIEELGGKVGADIKETLEGTKEAIIKKAKELYDGFLAKAKGSFEALSKEDELYKLSKKSAKSAARKGMVGKGIRIGIVVALLGSIILSFVASKKANKRAQQMAAMQASAPNQAQGAQEQTQITPQQAQMLAYMAQQQNAASQNAAQAQSLAAEIPVQSAMAQIKPLEVQQQAQIPMPQQIAQAQMPMPQAPIQPQIMQAQAAQNSAAQYFKTPMQSPLV